jgi:hypothetical protein
VRKEGYKFIRGSTSITWDKVSGQTGGHGWVSKKNKKFYRKKLKKI